MAEALMAFRNVNFSKESWDKRDSEVHGELFCLGDGDSLREGEDSKRE